MPRFLLLLRAAPSPNESPSLQLPPSPSSLDAMRAFNASLPHKIPGAEILTAEGLHPSANSGARVRFSPHPQPEQGAAAAAAEGADRRGSKVTVTRGPFPCEADGEEGRVVCGFWIVRVRDEGVRVEELVEKWVKGAPVETEIEVREIIELGGEARTEVEGG